MIISPNVVIALFSGCLVSCPVQDGRCQQAEGHGHGDVCCRSRRLHTANTTLCKLNVAERSLSENLLLPSSTEGGRSTQWLVKHMHVQGLL